LKLVFRILGKLTVDCRSGDNGSKVKDKSKQIKEEEGESRLLKDGQKKFLGKAERRGNIGRQPPGRYCDAMGKILAYQSNPIPEIMPRNVW
jgi:hypothetical protein